MTTVAKLHLPPLDCHNHSGQPPPGRKILRNRLLWDPVGVKSRRRIWIRPCRSFKSDQEGLGFGEREKKCKENLGQEMESSSDIGSKKSVNKFVDAIRDAVWRASKPSLRSEVESREAIEKLEETLFSLSMHIGRYIVIMLSTGVILLIGFQLSGGDEQMNDLVWYSWLGGIIIGTMIGSNDLVPVMLS